MIASVGMAVCKRAATPTALHVIAENSMTCIMSVVQSVRSAVMPQSAARRPTTTSTSVDSDIHIGRCAWTEGNRSPQGRAGERRPISSCFLYRRKQDFLNGQRPLFYRGSCCRHAAHGVGDGGDDKEENSFSAWRHHRHQKGEADNSRHGFLYLNPAIIDKNGLYVRLYGYLCRRSQYS